MAICSTVFGHLLRSEGAFALRFFFRKREMETEPQELDSKNDRNDFVRLATMAMPTTQNDKRCHHLIYHQSECQ